MGEHRSQPIVTFESNKSLHVTKLVKFLFDGAILVDCHFFKGSLGYEFAILCKTSGQTNDL